MGEQSMPVGIIINCLAVLLGGIIGAAAKDKISAKFKENLNMIFGISAMTMGITNIILMQNMPAVILTVILGTVLGTLIHFNDLVTRLGAGMQSAVSKVLKIQAPGGLSKEDYDAQLITTIVLFCASGTGIYGSIVSGMNGDHSILLAKSILDLFTALIFACSLGAVVSLIAVPQFILFFALFLCGGLIFPYTTPSMIGDFKAVGGILILATGFRILKLKMFPVADMIPAMILALPLSHLWSAYIAPLF